MVTSQATLSNVQAVTSILLISTEQKCVKQLNELGSIGRPEMGRLQLLLIQRHQIMIDGNSVQIIYLHIQAFLSLTQRLFIDMVQTK